MLDVTSHNAAKAHAIPTALNNTLSDSNPAASILYACTAIDRELQYVEAAALTRCLS
jgi:hypothetical protein